MRFTLVYQGDLPPNAGSTEKARIRATFDPQLRRFWRDLWPEGANYKDPKREPSNLYVGRTVGSIEYIPVITDRLRLRAELEITLFSTSRPGDLINNAGDIDNRLKTLLDALSVPSHQQANAQCTPSSDDNRVYCLLDDDSLVTRLDISNDRLLTLELGSREAMAIVRVRPVPQPATLNNLSLCV